MHNSDKEGKEQELEFDIRRAILLSAYIKHWGQPLTRTIASKKDGGPVVEVYEFVAGHGGLYRFATIGISLQTIGRERHADWEFLFCLPEGFGGAERRAVTNYLLDIMAYSLRQDVEIRVGTLIPTSALAPLEWSTKAILVDEARGEPEEASAFVVGEHKIDLYWLIPITPNEFQFIKTNGINKFDDAEKKSKASLLDVNRKDIVRLP